MFLTSRQVNNPVDKHPPSRDNTGVHSLNQIHHIVAGNGPPLLFIHGLFDSLETWTRLTPFLSHRFKIYAIDLPGFGKTPLPLVWKESLTDMVRTVMDFLDEKKLEKVFLVGNSMGGGVALAMAEKHPERLAKLALLNPYGLPEPPLAVQGAQRPIIGRIMPYFLKKSAIKQCAKGIFKRSLHNQKLLNNQLIERVIQPFSTLQERKDLFRFLRAISIEKILEVDTRLPEIKQPVMILWGENDGWLSERHWKRLCQRLPTSKLVQISACGHLPQMEQPEQVASELLSFFGEGQ